MKRIIFTLCFLALAFAGSTQTTYYWVGGSTGDVFTAASWNTALNGSGTDRTISDTTDVLIFDGTNISGAAPSTGNVTPVIDGSFTISQLFFQNGVNVTLKRNTLSPFGSGTTNIRVEGDGNPVTDDFIISSTSTVSINADATGFGTNLVLGILNTLYPVGRIYGTLNIADAGFATTRLTATNLSALFVENGGKISSNLTFGTSSYPFGTGTTVPAAASSGIVFNAGSQLIYVAGNSVMGNTSAFQPAKFNAGSTLEMNANNPTGMFNSKSYANLLVKSPAVVTLAENFFNIDTLTINSGATFNMRTTGTSPFSGDIINNGTFGAGTPTSANLVLIGIVPQTIRGTGTFNNLGAFGVGTDAEVTLNRNLNIVGTSTSNITGKLNTQTNVISGTGAFQLRTANAGTATAATITAGTNAVVLTDATAYSAANVSIGARVIGPAFQPNTYVISTNSGTFTFTISKPATTSYPALSGTVTLTTLSPSLETANAGGVDATITTSGTKTYGTNVNYTFNAATTAPFAAAATTSAGNVTFNAAATTNKSMQNITGTLTLGTGKLTIRPTDTLRISSGNAIGGAPFSSTKYIVGALSGNDAGVLRMDNLTAATLFPVGTATSYLPVTLTPTSAMDFAVSAFEGITLEGTPTGTPFTAMDKEKVVDAVWTINRINGTGDCVVNLGWTTALEGSGFTAFPDGQIGVGRHDGIDWGVITGTGDNTANFAFENFNTFSPFMVGDKGAVVPVILRSIAATIKSVGTEIAWEVLNEDAIDRYVIEKSTNGTDFSAIGYVSANNRNRYSFVDVNSTGTKRYYRIKIIGLGGYEKYSYIVVVKQNNAADIDVYPNPVSNILAVNGLKDNSIIKIVNAAGQIVLQQKTNANTISIDVSQFRSGLYVMEVSNGIERVASKSFIKE